ncbi:MAG: hypothetical protein EKK41_07530 [Hyphomicrobiales bacterium]|nr:MAG: hypothetical protein EKK41_07530 [Hyphomicrobiales bacterium]
MDLPMSETEMRVLCILEEFQYENVPAMMNTIFPPTGDAGELASMLAALGSLVQRGLLSMCIDRDLEGYIKPLPVEGSLDVIQELGSHLIFDAKRGLWTDSRRQGPPFTSVFPRMLATREARDLRRSLMNERGDRWWRAVQP